MDFPQYRRYSNGSSYFKILDDRTFIEYQVVGNRVFEHRITAIQYPEILRIKEMLGLELPGIEVADGEHVESLQAR